MKLPAIERSLAAVKEWNAKFMRQYPLLKPQEKEDAFGNRKSGSFQRTIVQHEEAHDLPTPPAVKPVRILGGITGALAMAGATIAGVALHGTATPVAMFFGGIALSMLAAVTGAMIAPAVAVIGGSLVVGTAALAGIKLPGLPKLPEIPLPQIDLERVKETLSALPGLLKEKFQKAVHPPEKPADAPVAPPSPPTL